MYISLFFFLASLIGLFLDPIGRIRLLTDVVHQRCLSATPDSIYKSEYQSLICGAKIFERKDLIQGSGLIHWLLVFGVQIYFVHFAARKLFHTKNAQNIFTLVLVSIILMMTAFHPSSLRLAIALFLRQLSNQKKLFWSPLHIAIFSGFFCIGLEPRLVQSFSLLIGWVAAISFGYFLRFNFIVKILATPILLFPVIAGFSIPHPLLSILFAFFSRPVLFIILPLSIFACLESHVARLGDYFWKALFIFAQKGVEVFSPIQAGQRLSILEIWAYLIALMTLLLYLEHKNLKAR